MTSSGISISKELDAAFGKARAEGNTRFLECDIVDEALTVTHVEKATGTAEEQWAAMRAHLRPKLPLIFLFRLDEKHGELGFAWVFVSYVPDGSPVRKRMLFASSREQCKKELGGAYFVADMAGSQADELSWAAYQAHVAEAKTVRRDDVLSATERALVREAVQEVDHGGSNAHAVRFPASAAAKEALASSDALVVLRLDLAKETIELAERLAALPLAELVAHIDRQEPRFVVYRWDHEHEGEKTSSRIFVYSCPETAPVKVCDNIIFLLLFSCFSPGQNDHCDGEEHRGGAGRQGGRQARGQRLGRRRPRPDRGQSSQDASSSGRRVARLQPHHQAQGRPPPQARQVKKTTVHFLLLPLWLRLTLSRTAESRSRTMLCTTGSSSMELNQASSLGRRSKSTLLSR